MWPYRSYRLLEVEVVFKLDVVVHLLGILGDAMKGYIENVWPELVIAQRNVSNFRGHNNYFSFGSFSPFLAALD